MSHFNLKMAFNIDPCQKKLPCYLISRLIEPGIRIATRSSGLLIVVLPPAFAAALAWRLIALIYAEMQVATLERMKFG